MKILSAKQIRELDQYTIANEPIRSIDLMERASIAFVDRLNKIYPDQKSFFILCGKGNNGGDGLAIARLLDGFGFIARVVILEHSKNSSIDHDHNLKRLTDLGRMDIASVSDVADLPMPKPDDLIIDAILGSGLDRPLDGLIKDCVRQINSWPNEIVSVDIPTGLFSDFNSENKLDSVLRSSLCITFHAPKLAFFLSESAPFVPRFDIVDIGLDPSGEGQTNRHYLVRSEVAELIDPVDRFSHKGTYGHALIVAGSLGRIGAAILCAKSTLKSGCGLVSVRTPLCGLNPMQTAFPEAMCLPDASETHLSGTLKTNGFSAVGIGPGIGVEKGTQHVLKMLIQDTSAPMVLDADALNILSENPTWMAFLPTNTILTPHPKEFDRLTGKSAHTEERLKKQLELAAKSNCIVLLKGAHTSIACPDGQLIFNSTGNPGMATAGSGDVLTGILTGLLAQGYHPKHAAIIGTYLHGLAGDLAYTEQGREALIASDIIGKLGEAFKSLREKRPGQ